MLVEAEKHRHGMYSVIGTPALMSIIIKTVFSPPNKDESPYFALLIASTRNFAGGMDSGFGIGIDLFDDNLVMLHAKQYNGPFRYIKELMINMGTGELARQYFTSTLPEGVEVKIGEKITFKDHGPDVQPLTDMEKQGVDFTKMPKDKLDRFGPGNFDQYADSTCTTLTEETPRRALWEMANLASANSATMYLPILPTPWPPDIRLRMRR
eukprot:scaffold11093_cov120-Skeletonema_marinoi.AAC.1